MPQIKVSDIQDGPHLVPDVASHHYITDLTENSSLEEEIMAMVQTVRSVVDTHQPDVVMQTCMSLMARCTELHIQLVRVEKTTDVAKKVRTMQLRPLMENIDFTFKVASRLVEVARQEVELSR